MQGLLEHGRSVARCKYVFIQFVRRPRRGNPDHAIQILVVVPGLQAGSFRHTLPRAALFGLVTYATYDLTNLATLEGFPLTVALVDLVWGAVLCSSVSSITYLLSSRSV